MRRNQILFFLASGSPSKEEQAAAEVVTKATGATVVFRNAACCPSNEKPESCAGVAGKAPDAYKELFDFYGDDGKKTAAIAPVVTPAHPFGLPEGSPTDREGLREALKEHKVKFHQNAKTETLAALYKSEVVKASQDSEGEGGE